MRHNSITSRFPWITSATLSVINSNNSEKRAWRRGEPPAGNSVGSSARAIDSEDRGETARHGLPLPRADNLCPCSSGPHRTLHPSRHAAEGRVVAAGDGPASHATQPVAHGFSPGRTFGAPPVVADLTTGSAPRRSIPALPVPHSVRRCVPNSVTRRPGDVVGVVPAGTAVGAP